MFEAHFRFFVGIDVAKATLAVHAHDANRGTGYALEISNTALGFTRLISWLNTLGFERSETILVMENTGCYHQLLAQALVEAGYYCSVVKTTALAYVKPSHHRKDDLFDAQLLAEYARRYTDRLSRHEGQSIVLEQLKLIYNERRRLVTELGAIKSLEAKNRFQVCDTDVVSSIRQARHEFIQNQIGVLEFEIGRLIESEAGLQFRYRQLCSIAGIGSKTAWLWLYFFYGQDQLNARRISSRFGFASHLRHSGTSLRHKGYSAGHGNREMRMLLTMCALSACRHHRHYRDYKQRKLDQGKPKMVITNNVRNKLIRVICAVWNQKGIYDEEKLQKNYDRCPVAA